MNDTEGFSFSFWRRLADCHDSRSSDKAPYITRTNEHFNQSCLDLENPDEDVRKGTDLNYVY